MYGMLPNEMVVGISMVDIFIQLSIKFQRHMIKNVNMAHLLSLSVQLVNHSCSIVQNSYMNKDVKQYMKGVNDPVTEADFKIQTMLIRGFRKHYPTIKIVGQEETEYQGDIDCDYEHFKFPFLPINQLAAHEEPEEDLCIWIDPIDNTKGFIHGCPEDVTILVGISRKERAQMGIVGVPFKKVDGKSLYDPSVIIGSVTDQSAYEYLIEKKEWIKLNRPTIKETKRVVTSPHRQSQIQKKILAELGAERQRVGGSGRKIMMVVKEESEMSIYASSYTYKWDSCAGEAIVHSLKGLFTSQYGDPILYNPEMKNEPNREGFLCTFDDSLHGRAMKICLEDRDKK